jgi:hypothetical protein
MICHCTATDYRRTATPRILGEEVTARGVKGVVSGQGLRAMYNAIALVLTFILNKGRIYAPSKHQGWTIERDQIETALLMGDSAMVPPVKPTWDRVRPATVPPLIFWPVISIIVFSFGDILLALHEERPFLATQLLLAALAGFIPLFYDYASRAFNKAATALAKVLWLSESDFDAWLEARQERLFRLSTWTSLDFHGEPLT